jgi:hypothetical protein
MYLTLHYCYLLQYSDQLKFPEFYDAIYHFKVYVLSNYSCHDIAEILLKVALGTRNQSNYSMMPFTISKSCPWKICQIHCFNFCVILIWKRSIFLFMINSDNKIQIMYKFWCYYYEPLHSYCHRGSQLYFHITR